MNIKDQDNAIEAVTKRLHKEAEYCLGTINHLVRETVRQLGEARSALDAMPKTTLDLVSSAKHVYVREFDAPEDAKLDDCHIRVGYHQPVRMIGAEDPADVTKGRYRAILIIVPIEQR